MSSCSTSFSARALGGLIETLNKADWKAANLPGAKT